MGKAWTKDMEREQLRKIEELINETESGSYIRMAFAGCVKLARENIEYDFGNSYPDMIDVKDKEIMSLRERINELQKKLDGVNVQVEVLTHDCENWEENSREAGEEFRELQEQCAELNERCAEQTKEILRLKAEIYDLERSANK